MAFLDLARNRYSCRKYHERPVEQAVLDKVLEAARIAPSAANKQPWFFIVVNEKKLLEEVKRSYNRTWLESAPMLIVLCGDHSRSWKRPDGKDHCDIDIAIATDHMTLAATELGLATCWICHFDAIQCSKVLQLPEHIEPIVILPIGYPADSTDPNRHATLRLPMDEVVRWNGWE